MRSFIGLYGFHTRIQSLGARFKSKSAVSRWPEELREFGSYTMELGRLSLKAGALQMLTLQTFPLDGLDQVSTSWNRIVTGHMLIAHITVPNLISPYIH